MKILVTGATGQIGSELVPRLRRQYGKDSVVANLFSEKLITNSLLSDGPAETFNALDVKALAAVVEKHQIDTIYHLVGILSARGEQDPDHAWQVNMETLRGILAVAVKKKISRIFWPSSIAAFGPRSPRTETPQHTVMEPTTMYGVTKVAGELLVQYYHQKYDLDVRSVRLPGIISYQTEPGRGTTDYAVDIFYQAILQGRYTCFVRPDTILPMMYMDDALDAMISLMHADAGKISVRTSYNLSGLNFTARELAASIQQRLPSFQCTYEPDFRQQIADSWPQTIDDSRARRDWGWAPKYNLNRLVDEMLKQLNKKLA